MADRPVIMSADSVQAILERRKGQTRRVLSRTAFTVDGHRADKAVWEALEFDRAFKLCKGGAEDVLKVPRNAAPKGVKPGPDWTVTHRLRPVWQVGDRLWVREGWCPARGLAATASQETLRSAGAAALRPGIVYRVDDPRLPRTSRWRSPRFMPKWAARLWLEVTGLVFERLQDISADDCVAEGVRVPVTEEGHVAVDLSSDFPAVRYLEPGFTSLSPEQCAPTLLRAYFASGWDSLNAKRGFPWEDNPWVLVVGFRLARGPSAPAAPEEAS